MDYISTFGLLFPVLQYFERYRRPLMIHRPLGHIRIRPTVIVISEATTMAIAIAIKKQRTALCAAKTGAKQLLFIDMPPVLGSDIHCS